MREKMVEIKFNLQILTKATKTLNHGLGGAVTDFLTI